ncbi:MAG: response regulator [Gemmatimonadetes bacterium]|nr:response regulator [Gemmatimonadota bacterium]
MSARILVVEDSPTQGSALRLLLEANGHEAILVTSGEEALGRLAADRFDLVVSDVMLPGIDGFALCGAIKSDARVKDTPVLLVTALSGPGDVIQGLQRGADGFIRKPYDEKYLLSRVSYLLVNREVGASEKVGPGIEIQLGGERHLITSERRQILDLLISTYEEALHLNRDLEARQRELERSYRYLDALYQIAVALGKATSEAAVATTALEGALELPGIEAGWVVRREGDAFQLLAGQALPPALQRPEAWEGDCRCRRMVRSGELVRSATILECERLHRARADTRGVRYHASVPLWVDERTVALMNLAASEEGVFDEHVLRILNGVGNHVGIALERARLHERLEERVSERTAALAAEVGERERLTAIIEATPDFVAIADPDGRAVYLNRGGRKMVAVGEDEDISGFRIAEGHPGWARDLVLKEGIPTAIREGVWSGETALLSAGGREIPVWQVILAHKGPGGAVNFLSTIARDMTRHVQLEQQLRQAQKMEAVGTLAGGVAHDFNNLLTAIRGNVDLALLDLEPESPVREYVNEIRASVDRAATLTRQLLAFGRKQMIERRALDLNALLSDTNNMLRRIIGEDIRLITDQTPDPTTVFADPAQLEQVVMNLCANARDAMPGGGELAMVTERIVLDPAFCTTHLWAQPGEYVRLTVSDTGAGMDAATQARIFEPFFTTKERGRGTGLGLAVVYGIVLQHGGFIHVQSERGHGSRFEIYLPLHAGAVAPVVGEPAPEVVGGNDAIFLAEDDDALRATASRLLERLGYRVTTAADGRQALEVLEARGAEFELALLDVVMPWIGGPAVAERVASRHHRLRFLFTTGYAPGLHPGAPSAGLPGPVLPKPYGLSELARAVRRALDA